MRSSREYPEHPLVGVGAFIHKRGKVLLVKRRFEPGRGKWVLPGGLLEVGESMEDAARREAAEELGIKVKIERFMQVVDQINRDAKGRVRFHYVLVDYLARPLGTNIALNKESSAYGWFTPDEVEGLNTTRNTKLIVRRYVQRRFGQSVH
jgi:8-oxo-dGTP diphosphatase